MLVCGRCHVGCLVSGCVGVQRRYKVSARPLCSSFCILLISSVSNYQRDRPVFIRSPSPPTLHSPLPLPSNHGPQEGERETSDQPDGVSGRPLSNSAPCSCRHSTNVQNPVSCRTEEQEDMHIHTMLRIPAEGRSGDVDVEVRFCRSPGDIDPFAKDGLHRSRRSRLRRRHVSYDYEENSGRCQG